MLVHLWGEKSHYTEPSEEPWNKNHQEMQSTYGVNFGLQLQIKQALSSLHHSCSNPNFFEQFTAIH